MPTDFLPHDLTSETSHSPFKISATSQYAGGWADHMVLDGSLSTFWIGAHGSQIEQVVFDLDNVNGSLDFAPHTMSSGTLGSITVTGSSHYGGGFEFWRPFAGGDWIGTNSGVEWIEIDFGAGNTHVMQGYEFRCADASRQPNTWTMLGSNDGSTWTTIDTVSGESGWYVHEMRGYDCDDTSTAYRYFKISITATNGGGSYTMLREIRFWSTPASTANRKTCGSYALQMDNALSAPRAPKNWTLEGSNGGAWHVLHTATNETGWSSSEIRNWSTTGTPTDYQLFRLNITANNGDNNYMQIGEVYMYTASASPQELDFSGIATEEALGTLILVYPQSVAPAGIASEEALGALHVIGNQPVYLPGVAAGDAVGVPILAGPITFSGIATTEALGSLGAIGNREIDFPGIATGEAVGTPRIAYLKTVGLEGIAAADGVGALHLAYSQGVLLPSVLDGSRMGSLTVSGGRVSTRLYIGGVDRSKYLRTGTARIDSQTAGRWTASFDLKVKGFAYAPALGETVLIQDFGRRTFAGCIDEIIVDRLLSSISDITFRCTARDKTSICDHRVVTNRTYESGTDVADVFRDLIVSFLVGEGILADQLPGSIDTIDSTLILNYESVTSAFDKAAAAIGAVWWVDVDGFAQLRMVAAAPACPFSIGESSHNWRALTVKTSLKDYSNAVYVRSNLSTLPSGQGYTISYHVNQAEAAAAGLWQGSCFFPVNVASILSLKVNGVEKTVYDGLHDPEVLDATNPLFGRVWWMFPGSPYLSPPGSTTSVPHPPEEPAIGDYVEIEYIPSVTSTAVAKATSPFTVGALPGATQPAGESYGTCGSGIYESVQQVNDIVSPTDLQAIASSIVARYGKTPYVLQFETDAPGAAVGQKLSVDLPRVYMPTTELIITAVSGVSMAVNLLVDHPEQAFDGRGSSFRYQVTAATDDLGNWMKFFERLYRRTEHPNPVIRESLTTFIIAPGASVVSGTVDSNPKRVTQTQQLFECYAVAGVAPVDQDLYLDIKSSGLGGGSILAAPLRIPAGSTTLHSTTAFSSDPMYLFKNDVLTCVAYYVVTGSSPTPAGSVSFDIVGHW